MRSLAAALLVVCACTGTSPEPLSRTAVPPASANTARAVVPAKRPRSLEVDAAPLRLPENRDLAERVTQSPHAYFRFIGHAFGAVVCERHAEWIKRQPRARLHGDPHVEQYTVSDLGRGLSDYDQAAAGPPLLDLLRMATSLELATDGIAAPREAKDKLLDELLRGYDAGLSGAQPAQEPPAFAAAIAKKFSSDRKGFLEAAEKNMAPLQAEEAAFLTSQLARYRAHLTERNAGRTEAFFAVKKQGRLRLGIGSALRRKFLLRLEGPTPKPDDDVVVEFKEADVLSDIPCVSAIPQGSAERRADEQREHGAGRALLEPAYFPDSNMWVNEWLANYAEARIKKLAAEDYGPLAYEVGIALGREHTQPLPDGSRAALDALRAGRGERAAIAEAAVRLADEVRAAHRKLVGELAPAR